MNGGTGNDRLEGDSGDDLFVFAAGGGADVILDFEKGAQLDQLADVIEFQGHAGITGIGDLDSNGDLRLDAGDSLSTVGTLFLDANDLHFT